MEQEELIKNSTRGLYSGISLQVRSGMEPDAERLLEAAMINAMKLWGNEHRVTYRHEVPAYLKEEYEEWRRRTEPEMRQAIGKMILRARKADKVRMLGATGTSALVEAKLSEIGAEGWSIYIQCHRVVVYIPLKNGRKMKIPVRYKDAEACVNAIPEALEAANRLAELYGKDFIIG